MADRPRPRQAAHPTPLTYLKVAAILAVLTAVEVAVFYIEVLEPAFLPIFLILSVAKFILVIMFYMHLKFDSRFFSWVFVGGLILAIAVAVALMSLFQVLSAVANPDPGEEPVFVESRPAPEVEEPVPEVEEPGPEAEGPGPEIDEPGPGAEEPGPEVVEPTAPSPAEPSPADLSAMGRELFLNVPDSVGVQPLWCQLCHQIDGIAVGLIGPDLTHIATDAGGRIPGMSAEAYIRESIKNPEDFIASGVERSTAGLMTNSITTGLTDEQVDALVAFLLEQE